jgi:endonuclease YncB( thermonuclease family)
MIAAFALAAAVFFTPAAGSDCAQISVHDGDTIRCGDERIRLLDIEAPEVKGSPRCRRNLPRDWCDYELGDRSRVALERFLRSGRVRIHRDGHDRYRRTLARITVDGRDAGQYLIARGFARPYR